MLLIVCHTWPILDYIWSTCSQYMAETKKKFSWWLHRQSFSSNKTDTAIYVYIYIYMYIALWSKAVLWHPIPKYGCCNQFHYVFCTHSNWNGCRYYMGWAEPPVAWAPKLQGGDPGPATVKVFRFFVHIPVTANCKWDGYRYYMGWAGPPVAGAPKLQGGIPGPVITKAVSGVTSLLPPLS